MRRAIENDDHVTARYTGYPRTLLPTHALIADEAVHTTEQRERWLVQLLQKLPDACCFRRSLP